MVLYFFALLTIMEEEKGHFNQFEVSNHSKAFLEHSTAAMLDQ